MGLNLKSTPGNPTAHHVLPYQPVLDIVFAAAITGVLALTVAYVVLKTGKSVRVSPA
jgi:hypothetical protein